MKHLLFICFILLFFTANAEEIALLPTIEKPKTVYRSAEITINQISPNTFQHISSLATNDFGKVPCNGLIVRDKNEVVIFDTPTNDKSAEALILWVKKKLHCQIKAIVPTHFHGDCLGGLQAFHAQGIPSIAHELTLQLAQKNEMVLPQKGFTEAMELKVGNEKVLLHFFGEGHTKDNIVAFFPKEQVLFGGCLIKEINATQGFLGDANVKAWPTTVQKVKEAYPAVQWVIPGHGEAGSQKLLDYTIQLFAK
jgi:metallo-beta-lactamase class B